MKHLKLVTFCLVWLLASGLSFAFAEPFGDIKCWLPPIVQTGNYINAPPGGTITSAKILKKDGNFITVRVSGKSLQIKREWGMAKLYLNIDGQLWEIDPFDLIDRSQEYAKKINSRFWDDAGIPISQR